MSELFINPARTCACSGHRIVDRALDIENLKQVFIKIINAGYNTFLIGMALGFDTLCFKVLYQLKEQFDIKLVACIPCENQDLKFSKEQKETYQNMLLVADEKVYVGKEYTDNCMQKRNEYMVKNSSAIVVYLRRDFGGTFKTLELAKQRNLIIIEV